MRSGLLTGVAFFDHPDQPSCRKGKIKRVSTYTGEGTMREQFQSVWFHVWFHGSWEQQQTERPKPRHRAAVVQ
jgi:hypothetical protein